MSKKINSFENNKILLLISTIIITFLMSFHMYFMITNSHKIWFVWLSFIFSTIIIFTIGLSYFKKCYKEIFVWKKIGMFTLIILATTLSYLYSLYPLVINTINYSQNKHVMLMDFFDTSAMIITISKIGDFINDKLKLRLGDDLNKINQMQIYEAYLYNLKTKESQLINVNKLNIGEYVLVPKDSIVPIDGVVVEGKSYIDESMISGEAKPIHKKINDRIIGGTKNLSSKLIIKVTTLSKDTIINKIINNVKRISFQKQNYQKIIDKISMIFTPFIIGCALLTFILQLCVENISQLNISFNNWFNLESIQMDKISRAFFYAIGTLSIACPCAIGIASPLIISIGTSKATKNGIIINTAEAFEKNKKINVVAFDKTGTLTEGKFKVIQIIGDKKNIPIMYYLESHSIHPIAKSFRDYCFEQNIQNISDDKYEVKEIIGVGVVQQKNNDIYEMNSLEHVRNNNFKFNSTIQNFLNNEYNQDNLLRNYICFSKNKIVENIVILEDRIKKNAHELIKKLKDNDIEILIISGDNQKNTQYVAQTLGINQYYYEQKPTNKKEIIEQYQNKGKIVSYVGDGINDLEALKQSNLSIVINKDNDIANSISDVLIVNDDIISILNSFYILKSTRKMILFNIFWAFSYNIVTLPLSILGIIPAFIGVFIMIFSNISILINSFIFKNNNKKII